MEQKKQEIKVGFEVIKNMTIGEVIELTEKLYERGYESDDLIMETFIK